MPGGYDFSTARSHYARVRPQIEDETCIFVPSDGSGLTGYVTFDQDAQRLKSAVEQLRLPSAVAYYFDEDTVLWVTDASAERAQALSSRSGRRIVFDYGQPVYTQTQ